jgi:hypothetical protein
VKTTLEIPDELYPQAKVRRREAAVKFLVKVNVIIPLLVSRHQSRDKATEWFGSTAASEVVFARLARFGALRLFSTAPVMGPDVLTPKNAIKALGNPEGRRAGRPAA